MDISVRASSQVVKNITWGKAEWYFYLHVCDQKPSFSKNSFLRLFEIFNVPWCKRNPQTQLRWIKTDCHNITHLWGGRYMYQLNSSPLIASSIFNGFLIAIVNAFESHIPVKPSTRSPWKKNIPTIVFFHGLLAPASTYRHHHWCTTTLIHLASISSSPTSFMRALKELRLFLYRWSRFLNFVLNCWQTSIIMEPHWPKPQVQLHEYLYVYFIHAQYFNVLNVSCWSTVSH